MLECISSITIKQVHGFIDERANFIFSGAPMDRTKEFRAIVQATEIPQPAAPHVDFYRDLYARSLELTSVLDMIGRLTPYEAFRAQPLLDRGYALVREYKQIPIGDDTAGRNPEIVASLRGIIRNNALRATLRLNETSRRFSGERRKSGHQPDDNSESGSRERSASQQSVQEELEQVSEVRGEHLQERRRVVKSISEIGQVVEDIAIHVSLQEEQLRRIDESMARTERWNKKALRELRETWEAAGENRGGMFKFFGMWLMVFVVFWFIKR